MEGKTLIFVILSGLCFLPACLAHNYSLVEKAKTWAEAQSYCRVKYTDLASVDNEEDLAELMTTAPTYFHGHVWIGLYDDINSWRWSLKKKGYYGEVQDFRLGDFRMWKSDKPNNGVGYENCVDMEDNGLWNDVKCNGQRQFLCYDENEEASSSFFLVKEPKTWKEAQSYCREHYTDLASVRNQAEHEWLKKMTQNQHTWIGLYRDSWKWSDGSPVSFTKWNTDKNEPNGELKTPCVLLHEGQWEDDQCDRNLFFVCQTEPVKRRVMRVKVKDSSVNLEDAAEAILQQFSQTLKDHGLGGDMKLTWREHPDGKIFNAEEKKKSE